MGRDNVDFLIDALAGSRGNLETFEDFEGLEAFENFSDLEMLEMMESLADTNPRAAKRAARAMKMRAKGDKGRMAGSPAAAAGKYAKMGAFFQINIQRVSANIPNTISVPIFGASALESAYTNTVTQQSGISITNVEVGLSAGIANANRALVTYTDLVPNVDTVIITCTTVPYPEFVKATITDIFHLSKIRYSISDATKQAQYQENINVIKRSLFGRKNTDDIALSTFQDPKDFKTNVSDIDVDINIDKETILGVNIINEAAFTVGLNVFVDKYIKQNAANEFYGK